MHAMILMMLKQRLEKTGFKFAEINDTDQSVHP